MEMMEMTTEEARMEMMETTEKEGTMEEEKKASARSTVLPIQPRFRR